MAKLLYAEHKNSETYILSYDVERDAIIAHMTVDQFISEIKRLNPQFTRVYTI